MIALQTFSQERKDEAQDYLAKNCQVLENKPTKCLIEQSIVNAASDWQNKSRPASNIEYGECLRVHGF